MQHLNSWVLNKLNIKSFSYTRFDSLDMLLMCSSQSSRHSNVKQTKTLQIVLFFSIQIVKRFSVALITSEHMYDLLFQRCSHTTARCPETISTEYSQYHKILRNTLSALQAFHNGHVQPFIYLKHHQKSQDVTT